MVISLILVGSLVSLTALSTISLTRSVVASGGFVNGVHSLGTVDLFVPSLLDTLGSAIVSPFSSMINFLMEYILTPFILIAFVVMFFVAQYYLFKGYFIAGKFLIEYTHKLVVKFHLDGKANEILTHLKKLSFH